MNGADTNLQAVAVIGMAGRFPGARTVGELWDNLCDGKESVSTFSKEELIASGVEEKLLEHPNYIKAGAWLEGVEFFDAEFFGYSPKEAEVMDPQHRFCLECSWEALEDAGYAPGTCDRPTGVYLSSSLSMYLIRNLLPNEQLIAREDGLRLLMHNDKDYLSTTVSHRLDLRGPSLHIGTACSSSLVAVHTAYHSLLSYQCDMALAGGVSIQVPQKQGYLYQPEGIYSPDGHCRAFDTRAKGTVGGAGVGILVLKRLQEALEDGDRVRAVIRGSAVNNDGANKVGYTAPSVEGQRDVIVEAQAVADVDPDSITYIEAHGTGTALGDPVEIEALTQAFRTGTDRVNYCAIGSVKTNIGHLDAAAGATGLIKTVLALESAQIPPSLHFEKPNPQIDFAASPFYVNRGLKKWGRNGTPRRGAVSAFGIGGTNAHMVLEEAPPMPSAERSRAKNLLLLSGKTNASLKKMSERLGNYLRRKTEVDLGDVAFTLAKGRRHFAHRRALVCGDVSEAIAALENEAAGACGETERANPSVVFLFPGQGVQHPGMAALYEGEPVFRSHFDECAERLRGLLGTDLHQVLFSAAPDGGAAAEALARTDIAQPALFTAEYALAKLWMHWGVRPGVMIGHGLGEYVAACLSGVLSLADALALVAERGKLMQQMPKGIMLSVALAENRVRPLLPDSVSLAAVNSPTDCVIGGTGEAVGELREKLEAESAICRSVPATYAFHPQMAEPLLEDFIGCFEGVELNPPQIPYLSNLTGNWIDPGQATSPQYWAKHMLGTVRFGDNLGKALQREDCILLEVGPGQALSALARRHPDRTEEVPVLPSLPHPHEETDVPAFVAGAVANMWSAGVELDWDNYYSGCGQRRLPLPTYAFAGHRHWIEPPKSERPNPSERSVASASDGAAGFITLRDEVAQWARRAGELREEMSIEGIDDYGGLQEGLNELCAAHLYHYLTSGVPDATAGGPFNKQEAKRRLGILPQYERLFEFAFAVLAEDGLIELNGDTATLHAGGAPFPQELERALSAAYPQFSGLIEFIGHCIGNYPHALAEKGAALQVLYPQGRGDLMRSKLAEETVEHAQTRVYTQLLQEYVLHRARSSRRLRILEVGMGEGLLTWKFAPLLQRFDVEYHATDIGRSFVANGREEAARRGINFMEFGVLDISRDPAAQGYAISSFDLVLGLDVVHATADIRGSVGHLKSLLVPGGVLGLVETVKTYRWTNLIWGLAEGWWAFSDGIRSSTPLINLQAWRTELEKLEFDSVCTLPQDSGAESDTGLILAQQKVDGKRLAAETSMSAGVLDWLEALPHKSPNLTDWFYAPTWKRSVWSEAPLEQTSGPALVFADECGLGDVLADELGRRGNEVVVVKAGDEFALTGERSYALRPGERADYERLLRELSQRRAVPRRIFHLWNLTDGGGADCQSVGWLQDRGIHSLLSLAGALGMVGADGPLSIVAISNGIQYVVGDELLEPAKATALGAIKVVPMEYPNVRCRSVDIVLPQAGRIFGERAVRGILAEADDPSEDVLVAHRGHFRWVQDFEHLPLERTAPEPPRLKKHGVYMILGGLGGIGLSLARYLGRSVGGRLVLTGRSPFPSRQEWDQWLSDHGEGDSTSQKIRAVQELEAGGAEVLVLRADIADVAEMENAVACAKRRFGGINGVIHCAGVADVGGVIHRRTREATEDALAAKVKGMYVLEQVLQDTELDFMVLSSSLGSILYKLKFGEAGYVAANDFLNAFAHYKNARSGMCAVAVNWTDWREGGMWARASERLGLPDLLHGIYDAEGVEAFRRILTHSHPQVVVSAQNFTAVLAQHRAFKASALGDRLEQMEMSVVESAQPAPQGDYSAPRGALEEELAAIWRELLGVERVGREDDFFDIGGDSLLAVRVISRLSEEFGINQALADIFDAPTLAELAAKIEAVRGRDGVAADSASVEEVEHEELVL